MKSWAIAPAFLVLVSLCASAQGLKQVAAIAIPGPPINQLGALYIDQPSGLGYLAEKDNKAAVVFDTTTNQFLKRITAFGVLDEAGRVAGPIGLVVVNDSAELWVSDGDSSVRIVNLKSGAIIATVRKGGRERANSMAYDPIRHVVLVVNSNEPTPFLSLVSTVGDRRIIAKIPVPDSAENMERSAHQASNGMFWTVIPVSAREPSDGLLAQTDASTGRLIALHTLTDCHPHSLQIVSEASILLGCSNGHGATPTPGGDLGVFDLTAKKIVSRIKDLGGNGSSDFDGADVRYVHATTNSKLLVIDPATRTLKQALTTFAGSRSVAIRQSSDRIYLATTAKDGPCGGCILVYGNAD